MIFVLINLLVSIHYSARSILQMIESTYDVSDQVPQRRLGDTGRSYHNNHSLSDDNNIFSKKGASRIGRRYQFVSSNSDAEIEFRRGSSLREGRYQYRRVS